jgi:hypothetical protein
MLSVFVTRKIQTSFRNDVFIFIHGYFVFTVGHVADGDCGLQMSWRAAKVMDK